MSHVTREDYEEEASDIQRKIELFQKRITNLTNLKHLYLNGDYLKAIPHNIVQLKNLELLDLSNNYYDEFPKVIADLKSLKYLCIGAEAINKVPKEIGHIEFLAINSNYNIINSEKRFFFPSSIDFYTRINVDELYKFSGLKSLDLSGASKAIINQIDFKRFPNLETLGLFYCNLKEIPNSIYSLTKLSWLELGGNNLKKFPMKLIYRLKNLKTLILIKNKIEIIPTEIKNLHFEEENIEMPYELLKSGLDFRENPVKNIPTEIINQGFAAVKNYFNALESGEVTSFLSAKLMIVGRGGVGKTSLVKKLIDSTFKVGKTVEETTRGIDILAWKFPLENQEENFEARIWDFGGQTHYLSPHHFFLTKRSVYVVVWDAREEDDMNFLDWLNIIKTVSDKSPIILVMNKRDVRVKEIDEISIKKAFPNIISFHKVSCTSEIGMDDLRREIQHTLIQLPHVEDKLPFTWKYIRNYLEGIRTDNNYISSEEYHAICKDNGLNTKQADHLSNYLHDLGTIIHFNTIPTLLDTVILNPQWLTNSVYAIIDDLEVTNKFGSFNYTDLQRVWEVEEYPKNKYGLLLNLLQKFAICFASNNDGEYITPILLPPSEPKINWVFKNKIYLQYDYSYLPNGIITRFIVRNHQILNEESKIWRNGVFIELKEEQILVKSNPITKIVEIEIRGTKDLSNSLGWVRREINNINSNFTNLEITKKIPCPCKECGVQSTKPYFYNLNLLLKRLEKLKKGGKDTVECQISSDDIKLATLLEGIKIETSPNLRYGVEQAKGIAFPQKKKAKIFVSYSSRDRDLREILVSGIAKHLKHREFIEYDFWTDKKIDLGSNWQEEIEKALQESQIALILVSGDFVDSSYIEAHEMYTFFKRKREENYLILPVLIRQYDFSQFEKLSTLNFFKTYYNEYGFNKPTERHKLMPFDKIGDDSNTTEKQLNDYYANLAEYIDSAATNHFKIF